jgi:GNAT superfamily N-acetyltransferase
MGITKVEQSELVEIMYLMRVCSIELNSMGCMFWDFMNQQIPELIEKGFIFKYKNNESTVGIIVLNNKADDEYDNIHWKYESGKVLSVRILVHPRWREKGISKELIAFAEKYALDNSYSCIRLDVNSRNAFTLELLNETKYEKAGEIHLPFHKATLYCLEKKFSVQH